jgi:hypothetical protein
MGVEPNYICIDMSDPGSANSLWKTGRQRRREEGVSERVQVAPESELLQDALAEQQEPAFGDRRSPFGYLIAVGAVRTHSDRRGSCSRSERTPRACRDGSLVTSIGLLVLFRTHMKDVVSKSTSSHARHFNSPTRKPVSARIVYAGEAAGPCRGHRRSCYGWCRRS